MNSWPDFFPAQALAGGAGWSWVATVVPALLLLGVLSISNPMSAANLENYFMRLAQEQYYASALEEPGRWYGEGAAQLGLRGTVAREHFHNLLAGLSPDGRRPLVQNAGKPDRQAGWDMTFSAHKRMSVVWGTGPEFVRPALEESHRFAVEAALAQAEAEAGITRRGKGGKIKERAALTFALFQHGSSRANDPQLHTHAVLLNVGLRRDGTAGALQSRDFFRLKMKLGALYQKELAAQLQSRLGLKMEPAKIGYRIAGVPPELCKAFSKRRQSIEKSLQARGEHGAVAAKEAALRTRQRKTSIPRAELFAAWQKEAAAHGWTQADTLNLIPLDKQQELARNAELTAGPTKDPIQQTMEEKAVKSASSGRDSTRTASQQPTASRHGQSAATQKESAESVRTGFEDNPDFVGPPRPEQRPARSKSASSSRDSTHTASQQPTASKQGQPAATPKISADSILTGFEDYPDFVGPLQPEQRPVWSKPAWASHDSTQAASQQHSATREGQSAATQKKSADSVRTGFEDYPDFVEPLQAEQEQADRGKRRKSASSSRRSSSSQSRQHQRRGASRKASSKQRRRASRRASAGSGWRPYQTAWKSPYEKELARQRFIRIERRRLFRKAPSWSPFSKLRPPVIAVGSAPAPRWGRVIWNKDLTLGHLRVQQRRLFPRAPQCSPLRYLSLPMLRLAKVPQLPAERRSRPWGRVQWEKNLVLFKVRVQKRQIFPRAALWTRAARLELPALRLVSRRTESPEPEPARLRERQQSQQRSH